jgi:hypothetical protein
MEQLNEDDFTLEDLGEFATLPSSRERSSIERLAWGVLERGILDYLFDKRVYLQKDASSWFWEDDNPNWPCSFLNICDLLKIKPHAVRVWILQEKQSPSSDWWSYSRRI